MLQLHKPEDNRDARCWIHIPKLIKQQLLKIRKSFTAGALMFDGSVNSDGTIGFSSVSKKFRDSISEILLEDGIKLSVSKKPNKSKRFIKCEMWSFTSSYELNLDQLKKLSFYFDKETLKHKIINFYLGKFRMYTLDDLKALFPKIRSRMHPADLLNILNTENMKKFDIYQLIETTHLSRKTLLTYIRILETANLLESEMHKHKRIYSLNNLSTNFTLLNSIKSE